MTTLEELERLLAEVKKREPGYGFAKIELDKLVAKALPGLIESARRVEELRVALQELYDCGCVAIDALDDAPEDVFGEAKAQEFEDALHEARAALKGT